VATAERRRRVVISRTLCKKIFFEKFFYTGKLNPETGIHFLSENLLLI
jgi:hypothetical protein